MKFAPCVVDHFRRFYRPGLSAHQLGRVQLWAFLCVMRRKEEGQKKERGERRSWGLYARSTPTDSIGLIPLDF